MDAVRVKCLVECPPKVDGAAVQEDVFVGSSIPEPSRDFADSEVGSDAVTLLAPDCNG